MQPTEHELQGYFAGLDDEALVRAARELDSLTSTAQRVLQAELAGRQIHPPEAAPVPDETTTDEQPIVSIRRFRDLPEALVARGALEASGIPCFLRNENTVRIDWQISNAIGGIRLDVLESDREAAEIVLAPADAGGTERRAITGDMACPACGSQDVHRRRRWSGIALASLFAFGLPVPRGPFDTICDACGARWRDED